MKTVTMLLIAAVAWSVDHEIIEAEAHLAGGSTAAEVDGAGGGKTARQTAAYQPLLVVRREIAGDPSMVWVRHRNGSVCLKGVPSADGKQVEIGWAWKKEPAWIWSRFAVKPGQIANGVVVIRDNKTEGEPTEVDQVVVDRSGTWQPGAGPAQAAP